jgi:hypothetical protein
VSTFPEISYFVEQYTDETIPCSTTLESWAEWLSRPAPDWNRPEATADGETFAVSSIAWQDDIEATLRAGGEWIFSRPFPADATLLAVRFGPGLGWSCDDVAYDEDGLREILAEAGGDGAVGTTELIAVGVEQPLVTMVYRSDPPRLEPVAGREVGNG